MTVAELMAELAKIPHPKTTKVLKAYTAYDVGGPFREDKDILADITKVKFKKIYKSKKVIIT